MNTMYSNSSKLNLLLEMRPAFDGYAGIPQETRLLFCGLSYSNDVSVEGLLQTSLHFLVSETNTSNKQQDSSLLDEVSRQSRTIIALETDRAKNDAVWLVRYIRSRYAAWKLAVGALVHPRRSQVLVTKFSPRHFEDFIWRRLFQKTLPASDFPVVTQCGFRICETPWNVLQSAGLLTHRILGKSRFPALKFDNIDIFIAQTPYPGRIDPSTSVVIRYHDAFPILMPHLIANRTRHQATHLEALVSNANSGAYFACVSEATRQDLIKLLPQLEKRSVAIHNMVSHDFFEDTSPKEYIPRVIRSRISTATPFALQFSTIDAKEAFYTNSLESSDFRFILVVSTIEPRKNHSTLLEAWNMLREQHDPFLKLVVVGNLGWNIDELAQKMRVSIEQGELFALSNVPTSDLRALYRHALVTVCPSVAEGFDYSGVECMASGGIVAASDIPVHHEIYDNAAEYFNPYSAADMANAIYKVTFDPWASELRSQLRERGNQIATRYTPAVIIPRWLEFLRSLPTKSKIN